MNLITADQLKRIRKRIKTEGHCVVRVTNPDKGVELERRLTAAEFGKVCVVEAI